MKHHAYKYQHGRTPVCERCGCRRRSVGSGRRWQYSIDGKAWTAERPPCKTPDFVGGWSDAIAAMPVAQRSQAHDSAAAAVIAFARHFEHELRERARRNPSREAESALHDAAHAVHMARLRFEEGE